MMITAIEVSTGSRARTRSSAARLPCGSSYAILPWIGVVSAAAATLIAAVSWARERRAG